MIRLTANTKAAQKALAKVAETVTPQAIDGLVHDEAIVTDGNLKRLTPKKWTGATRAAWQILKPQTGVRIVRNDSKVMTFLEFGTKAHGPVHAKALFVPLTRKAAFSDRRQFSTFNIFGPLRANQGRKGIVVRGQRRSVGIKLVYGVDYVLAKWVQGIKARRIAAGERPRAEARLKKRFVNYLKQVIAHG